MAALLTLAPFLSIAGDLFGYRLRFTHSEWNHISADSFPSLPPGDWLKDWDVLLVTSGGKRKALQTYYLHHKNSREKKKQAALCFVKNQALA